MGTSLLLRVAAFGAMWGVGNVSYGLTMRYLGMSLGIGVAIGVTLVVGTLVPPLMHGQGAMLFTTRSGLITMSGVFVALIGVAIVSWAGHQKEVQLKGHLQEFNVGLGLLLAVLCGIFSSGMSFAIDAAQPMEAAAKSLGVNPLYAALPSYVIIMGGGAIVNFAYCFIRLAVLPDSRFATIESGPQHAAKKCGPRFNRRNHVVSPVLLLCLGSRQHPAAPLLR